ncbi:ATP-binding protein [Rhizobium cauense]|uniref:ATP-binding protein n=1 Tax=Rhizobium cauense TaxID=1166683 RepID=UPI001CB78A4C|nr:winged helix-turn-helix domain-containing protein [Rhizobium cauense]
MSVEGRWLRKGNVELNLSSRAFDILIALVTRAGSIVSAKDLFGIVWPDVVVEASNLRVHIVALRKTLGDGVDGVRFVINVPGRGYMFACPVRKASETTANAALQGNLRLPAIPQLLHGRSETLEKLAATVLSKRLVSLVGPAGVGKTAVAIAAAGELRANFRGDICFLDLALKEDPTLALAAMFSIDPCPFNPSKTQSAIARFLSDKRVLLILDNCEHALENLVPLVARIIDEAPSVRLLVTSREVLRMGGEYVEFLAPLEYATPANGWRNPSPAVQLFLDRAIAGGGIATVDETSVGSALEICRRLDGLPIAIELVASHVGALGMLGIAELIERDEFLTLQGRRSASSRHQTIEALLDWSFELLSAEEQKLLLRLSTFAGVFTLEAVRSLYTQSDSEGVRTASLLASLVDKSLVHVSRSSSILYYKLLHVVRVYAARRVSKVQECHLRIIKTPAAHEELSRSHFETLATSSFEPPTPSAACAELGAR